MVKKKKQVKAKSGSSVGKYVITVVCFLVSFAGSMYGLNSVLDSVYMDNRKVAYDLAKTYTDEIEKSLRKPAESVSSIMARVRFYPASTTWFEQRAAGIIKENPSIIGIDLRREGTGAVVQSYPNWFSVGNSPALYEAYQKALEETGDTEGTPKSFGPIDLGDGEMGLLTVSPIYIFNSNTQGFDRWGTVSSVSLLPKAIEEANVPSLSEKNYAYVLYGNNGLLDDGGIVMSSELAISPKAESSAAVVGQGKWILKLELVGGFQRVLPPEAAIGVSFAFSLIVGAIAMLLAR